MVNYAMDFIVTVKKTSYYKYFGLRPNLGIVDYCEKKSFFQFFDYNYVHLRATLKDQIKNILFVMENKNVFS